MKLFTLSALFAIMSVILAATIPRANDSVQPAEGVDQGTSWLCYRGCLPAFQTCLWKKNSKDACQQWVCPMKHPLCKSCDFCEGKFGGMADKQDGTAVEQGGAADEQAGAAGEQ